MTVQLPPCACRQCRSIYAQGFRAGQQDMAYQTYTDNVAFTAWREERLAAGTRVEDGLARLDSLPAERWHE